MKNEEEWGAEDAVWRLLGKAEAGEAGGRFTDDVLRAVKQLQEGRGWWASVALSSAPWAGLAAVGLVVMGFLFSERDAGKVADEEGWVLIGEAAEVELLEAAAEDAELLSDHELVSLIGF